MRFITFSPEMVRAIIEGRKTMTRRIVKPQPQPLCKSCPSDKPCFTFDGLHCMKHEFCPYGDPGARLWVKEDWRVHPEDAELDPRPVDYKANPNPAYDGCRWRSSRFMPRWASRITLEVVSVRVERLQDISASDVLAEGVQFDRVMDSDPSPDMVAKFLPEFDYVFVERFQDLWNKLYRKQPEKQWSANPWVWVVEFKVVNP